MRALIKVLGALCLVGCAGMEPPLIVFGQYYQIFSNDIPVMEIEYGSQDECARHLKASFDGLDFVQKKGLVREGGKVVCSNSSVKGRLSYEGTFTNMLTGKVNTVSYPSETVCLALREEVVKARPSLKDVFKCSLDLPRK